MSGKLWLMIGMSAMGHIVTAQAFSFEYSGPQIPIPESPNSSATASIYVPGFGNMIDQLRVQILIEHPWQGDLKVTFLKDTVHKLTLMDQPGYPELEFGFSSANFGSPWLGEFMEFNDSADYNYEIKHGNCGTSGIKNVTGSWLPEGGELHSTFGNVYTGGVWRLTVEDKTPGARGNIIGFRILGETVPEPATGTLFAIATFCLFRRARRKSLFQADAVHCE